MANEDNISNAPGKGMLKIIGIIGIIGSGLACLAMTTFLEEYQPSALYALWMLLAVICSMYISIMAIAHCANLEKARFLKTLGIIDLVWTGIDIVMYMVADFDFDVSFFSYTISFAMPILYILNASKNEKAYRRLQQQNMGEDIEYA